MGSGPVCAMVWEGRDAVKVGRQLLGATNPLQSAPGTIRGDYAIVGCLSRCVSYTDADVNISVGRRPQCLPRL